MYIPPPLPNKESACVWSGSGKLFPPGASEESTGKVPKASTYVESFIREYLRIGHGDLESSSLGTTNVHPAALPNKESACVW